MDDLINAFMDKNLDDFVKSYATSVIPNDEEQKHSVDDTEEEHIPLLQQSSQTIEHKEHSPISPQHDSSSFDSFILGSVSESISSISNLKNIIKSPSINIKQEKNKIIISPPLHTTTNNKIFGTYSKTQFDLSVDVLPAVIMTENDKNTTNKNEDYTMLYSEPNTMLFSEPGDDDDWTLSLPNAVNTEHSQNKIENNKKSEFHDSFLENIKQEIENLDAELSSMGILTDNNSLIISNAHTSIHSPKNKINDTNSITSSDMLHDEEEKMEQLVVTKKPSSDIDNLDIIEENNSNPIPIIKDKLSLLRKSLVFKKKIVIIEPIDIEINDRIQIVPSTENDDINNNNSSSNTPKNKSNISDKSVTPVISKQTAEYDEFKDERYKDAYFDPLVSPIKIEIKDDTHDSIDYNKPLYHEKATKIQKQWKKFQFKTLLINTFNRHLKHVQNNNLPIILTDLMTSTTHEIVDHAEKLFSAVHNSPNNNNNNNSTNVTIGNFRYEQLHFYGSPALDWSSVYSMIESIVLRNMLYYRNNNIINQIFETQSLLNKIISPQNIISKADEILINQLTTQLIHLKTKLYNIYDKTTYKHIQSLTLFPNDINIFRRTQNIISRYQSNSPTQANQSIIQQQNNINPSSFFHKIQPNQNTNINQLPQIEDDSQSEFNVIKNKLTLLRKSFTQRKKRTMKLRSSVTLTESLPTPIVEFNNSPTKSPIEQKQMFTFDTKPINNNFNQFNERPKTAPNIYNNANSNYKVPQKRTFLKRKKREKLLPKKVDWSHVKPKTVSRLSQNVRNSRYISINNRMNNKPSVINWRQKASSRIDCKWSNDKYTPNVLYINNKNKKKNKNKNKNKNRNRIKQKQIEFNKTPFRTPQKHQTFNNVYARKINKNTKDKYLYYIKDGNKIGKIARDIATAQLCKGSGDMILKTNVDKFDNQYNNNNSTDNDNDHDIHSENQLKELQETFAAIEHAMKQRRQNSL